MNAMTSIKSLYGYFHPAILSLWPYCLSAYDLYDHLCTVKPGLNGKVSQKLSTSHQTDLLLGLSHSPVSLEERIRYHDFFMTKEIILRMPDQNVAIRALHIHSRLSQNVFKSFCPIKIVPTLGAILIPPSNL